jgi:O-methyltransferase
MYIELLKRCILDQIYTSSEYKDNILVGNYFPSRGHSMMGYKRLSNIQECFENVIKNNIEGDFIETGVWRGGGSIFAAGLNKFYNSNKKIYVADSFEGLPPPDEKYIDDAGDVHHKVNFLAVDLETVKDNFNRYDLLDNNVIFIKGFFENSLKDANIGKISILRLDGDMYSSTIQVLDQLYDKVSIGGYIIIDDYALAPCRNAVNDFRKKHNITSNIIEIDWTGIFWIKE